MGEFHTAFRASLQSLCCRFSYALQDPFTLAHFSNHFYSVKRAKKKRLKGRMCETGRVSRKNCHLLLKSNLSTKSFLQFCASDLFHLSLLPYSPPFPYYCFVQIQKLQLLAQRRMAATNEFVNNFSEAFPKCSGKHHINSFVLLTI